MSDFTKVNGVDEGDIVKVDGVARADIVKIDGGAAHPVTPPDPVATMWMASRAASPGGALLYVTNDPLTWPDNSSDRVDTGNGNTSAIVYGISGSSKQWMTSWDTSQNEIRRCASGSIDYVTTLSNWTMFDWGSPTHKSSGFANNPNTGIWMQCGANGGLIDGEYRPFQRSIDDGDTWTSLTMGLTSSLGGGAMTYVSGSTWLASTSTEMWKSTDDGASWAKTGFVAGNNIQGIAFDAGGGRGVARATGAWWYSDDYFSTATRATGNDDQAHIYGIRYVKGISKFVSVTDFSLVFTSSNGSSWTEVADLHVGGHDGSSDILRSIATDHTTIVIGKGDGYVYTSTDATTWTFRRQYGSGIGDSVTSISCDIVNAGKGDY